MIGWFRGATLLLAFAFVWVYLSALASSPVSIRTPSRINPAPVDYYITITVEPNPENRLLVLETNGVPGEYRRSDFHLAGEKAARIRQVWLKSLPAGCYHFFATVYDNAKRLASAVAGPIKVIGLDGDPCPES